MLTLWVHNASDRQSLWPLNKGLTVAMSAEPPKAGILGILDTEEHFPKTFKKISHIVLCSAIIYEQCFFEIIISSTVIGNY